MAGRKKKHTDEGKALRKKLYDQVNFAFIMEGINPNTIAYITGAGLNTVYGVKKNRDITTYNLVRLLDVMGYELKVTKIPGRVPMCDDPIVAPLIKRFNERQLYAKRKQRNQPTAGPLPTKVRIKKGRGKSFTTIISRRAIEAESHQSKTSFSKPFGE